MVSPSTRAFSDRGLNSTSPDRDVAVELFAQSLHRVVLSERGDGEEAERYEGNQHDEGADTVLRSLWPRRRANVTAPVR